MTTLSDYERGLRDAEAIAKEEAMAASSNRSWAPRAYCDGSEETAKQIAHRIAALRRPAASPLPTEGAPDHESR